MEGYHLSLKISSGVSTLLGWITQGGLLYYMGKQHHPHESRSYELFMLTYSTVALVRLFLGWLATSRLVMIPGGYVVFHYGLARYGDPSLKANLDMASKASEMCLQLLLPVAAIIRALLAWNMPTNKTKVGLCILALFLIVVVPYLAIAQVFFTSPSTFRNTLATEDYVELENYTGYGLNLNETWVNIMYSYAYPNLGILCQLVTLFIAVPTYVKLIRLKRHRWPERIRISRTQTELIILNVAFHSLYNIDVIIRLLSFHEILNNKQVILFFSAFHFPLTAFVSTIQGLLTTWMLPSLRKARGKSLTPKKKEEYFPSFVHIDHIVVGPRRVPARSAIEEAFIM